jgi:hypothetical protein
MSHSFLITLFVLYGLGAWSTVVSIGKARKPITHGQAVAVLVINAAICAILASTW